ncbi:MAG TPA: hypothetical protein VFH92_01505 [Phenylobacterium sp.]|nr:hypothetical protein [Phenylobacterium sp.]
MIRILAGVVGCASLVLATGVAAGQGQGPKGHKEPASQQSSGGEKGGGKGHAKHQHHDHNAHNLIGAKLKQDGKHAVGKFKDRDVVAEVKGGKVVAMAAGDLQGKRVRSKTKMAMEPGGLILAAWSPGGLQLAQYDSYSYGYCFDDGVNFDCYWYPPEDVAYQDYTWEDYDPTY